MGQPVGSNYLVSFVDVEGKGQPVESKGSPATTQTKVINVRPLVVLANSQDPVRRVSVSLARNSPPAEVEEAAQLELEVEGANRVDDEDEGTDPNLLALCERGVEWEWDRPRQINQVVSFERPAPSVTRLVRRQEAAEAKAKAEEAANSLWNCCS